MFQDQNALAADPLKARARTLGLDGAKFDECLDSKKYAEQVASDLEEGRKHGVAGTPALFINGRFLGGNQTRRGHRGCRTGSELRRSGRPIRGPSAQSHPPGGCR